MREIYKFLRLFWTPKCRHKWIPQERYGKQGGVIEWIVPPDSGLNISLHQICQCSKCGEWKSFKV